MHSFYVEAKPIYIPINVNHGFCFHQIPKAFVTVLYAVCNLHWCEVLSHCHSRSYLHITNDDKHSYIVLFASAPSTVFYQCFFFFVVEFYVCWILATSECMICTYFLFTRVSFRLNESLYHCRSFQFDLILFGYGFILIYYTVALFVKAVKP